MRIAHFVQSFPELSETFILRQLTGLLDLGHDVRVFAYRAATGGPAHAAVERYGLRERVTVLPHRSDAARPAIPPLHSLRSLRCLRRDYARFTGGYPTLARTLAALDAAGTFDVVHCHYGHIGLRYRVAACLWRTPLVVSFYGHDSSSYPREHGRHVYGPLFAAADAVVSLSTHMDRRLMELGCDASRLRRVPLAVDDSSPGHAAAGAGPHAGARQAHGARILTVARLTDKKGIEYALRALALLRAEFPELRYDVIGEGALRAELESLAGSLGVHDVVSFLGARDEGFVRAAMHQADVFVLPSVTAADGDEEGTPTVLLEAARCGLPAVSTMHAGIPEIVPDGVSGYLVPERDHVALADRLRRLLLSPGTRRDMGEAGRRLVEVEHATAAVAGKLDALYVELRRR